MHHAVGLASHAWGLARVVRGVELGEVAPEKVSEEDAEGRPGDPAGFGEGGAQAEKADYGQGKKEERIHQKGGANFSMQEQVSRPQPAAGGAVETGEGVQRASGIGGGGRGIKHEQHNDDDEGRQCQESGRELRVFLHLQPSAFFSRRRRFFPQALQRGLEILPGKHLLAGIPQQVGRMEGKHDGDAFKFTPLSPGFADGQFFLHEAAAGGGAEADDDLGFDDGDLPLEIGDAPGHFIGCGHTVAGGAAFDDIADEDFITAVTHGVDHFGEELAGAADKGAALGILVGTGAFADEHKICV